MRHLVIGIPARDEAATIGGLTEALDVAASLLGEVATVELVLAYQDSDDDTLGYFEKIHCRSPKHVLRSPGGTSGKGRNVKLLVEHAVASHADLLLVDGDTRNPVPADFARFVACGYDNEWDMVLPLWCRPWGHANATNYLAVPLIRSLFAASVRQPLAGQRLLARDRLRCLGSRPLPDDYGIDVALTMAVLEGGGHVGQVIVPRVEHDGRQLNSETIMVEVARTLLERIADPASKRPDLTVPDEYVRHLKWPEEDGSDPMDDSSKSSGSTGASEARHAWLDALATAVRGALGGLDPRELATQLVGPFLNLAERRRREPRPELVDAEAYVWDLAADLSERLS